NFVKDKNANSIRYISIKKIRSNWVVSWSLLERKVNSLLEKNPKIITINQKYGGESGRIYKIM
ncbi:MAG: hypothetical protein P8Y60_04100, partial [Calditrichota bacterium]